MIRLISSLAFFLIFIETSFAQEQVAKNYFYNFVRVPVEGVKEVFTLERPKLIRNSLAIAAVGLTYTQDKNIRDFWQDDLKNEDFSSFSKSLYDAGTPQGFAKFYAVTSVTGLVLQDRKLLETTSLSIQSAVVSQLFAEGAKQIAGRERPYDSEDDHANWGQGGKSFFSGHASGAFAAMTVFAEEYKDQPFIRWGSYGFATAISLSRINDDGHWSSDVLLGALIGYGVGKLTVKMSPFKDKQQLIVLPYPEKDGFGLMAKFSF